MNGNNANYVHANRYPVAASQNRTQREKERRTGLVLELILCSPQMRLQKSHQCIKLFFYSLSGSLPFWLQAVVESRSHSSSLFSFERLSIPLLGFGVLTSEKTTTCARSGEQNLDDK